MPRKHTTAQALVVKRKQRAAARKRREELGNEYVLACILREERAQARWRKNTAALLARLREHHPEGDPYARLLRFDVAAFHHRSANAVPFNRST
jgi:hypothetical protein